MAIRQTAAGCGARRLSEIRLSRARPVPGRRISSGAATSAHPLLDRVRRGLDYYTGFVFELHDPSAAPNGPLVAGGRYDELLGRLGAKSPIPAVGFAVWIERVVGGGGRS
jgi:hypothetical protein